MKQPAVHTLFSSGHISHNLFKAPGQREFALRSITQGSIVVALKLMQSASRNHFAYYFYLHINRHYDHAEEFGQVGTAVRTDVREYCPASQFAQRTLLGLLVPLESDRLSSLMHGKDAEHETPHREAFHQSVRTSWYSIKLSPAPAR